MRGSGAAKVTPMSETVVAVGRGALDTFEEQGWLVLEDVLEPAAVASAREALLAAADASEARGIPTRMDLLDPGGRNVRVHDLIEYAPVFAELATHPLVIAHVRALLGEDLMLSNFSANIALPGSRSMTPHNDQSTVMPEPWLDRHCMNAIWCLDDIDEGNGATRFLPRSHRYTTFAEVPTDPRPGMESFRARAGSVVLMDGRTWHTSGANTSTDRERALLFAFYSRSFLRHQNNWWRSLSPETRGRLDPQLKEWLGLRGGNMGHGTYLASSGRLATPEPSPSRTTSQEP